jgi:hypothetical protein
MRPAGDTVSAFFAAVLAKQWDDALLLLDPVAVAAYKDGYLTHTYGNLNLGPDSTRDPDAPLPTPLAELAARPVDPAFGVTTVAGLFALTPATFLKRMMLICCDDDEGPGRIPWGGRHVEILGERLVLEGIAEVRYAYMGQRTDIYDPDTIRRWQHPWRIRLRLDDGHWRMALPEAWLPSGGALAP